MEKLFRIETDKADLSWSGPKVNPAYAIWGTQAPLGRLVISLCRPNATFGSNTWRSEVPPHVADNPDLQIGPCLYEETNYTIFLKSKTADRVELRHRDPTILRGLNKTEENRIIHGIINFKGQVGRSRFTVLVGGKPEFDFEIEIFPSKLDYTSDYETLIADVQDILAALVLEYLQSTFQLGFTVNTRNSTRLEWLTLLRYVIDKLELSLRYIEQHPHRGLSRKALPTRIHLIHKPDSTVLRAVAQGKGSGPQLRTSFGAPIKYKLPERRSCPTLDTSEHRWLALQLNRIRRELAQIYAEEKKRILLKYKDNQTITDEDRRVLEEIAAFENRIARLQEIEPIIAAVGMPPAGFASITLQTAPGYREAYHACLTLLRGLRVSGGPVELSVKDIYLLYEYWCYLALVRLVSKLLGKQIPVGQLLVLDHDGLRVQLKRGYKSTVRFVVNNSSSIEVTYNPKFTKAAYLLPQQPDIVLTLKDPDWPTMRLVLDAKYRIEISQDYVSQFGSPGPPQDAINVLHRYRDAILEETSSEGPRSERLKHSVVEGAALFPYVDKDDQFSNSRFWTSLERLGIGAIPFLPNETRYLEKWLSELLRRGGWSIAERSIPHIAHEQLCSWREAAKEIVMVAVLRPNDPKQHLEWICSQKCYYTPLTPTQRRQFAVRWIAIYSPSSLRNPGAVTHIAPVERIGVLRRKDIQTPWSASHNVNQYQVIYYLGEVMELKKPIENKGSNGRGARVSQNRWTSYLGLQRAKELSELFLETEPEWRLYEELKAAGISFSLRPGQPKAQHDNEPVGRAWFAIDKMLVQYRGSAGFLARRRPFRDEYYTYVEDVIKRLI